MEARSRGYQIFRPIIGFFLKILYHPKIINKELIPKDGAVILAGNHRHLFDCLMAGISTKRTIHYMAKKELFQKKLSKSFFNTVGCIPIDRNNKNPDAKKEAIDLLNSGYILGIFPEGGRNRSENDLNDFKYGTVSLASKTGASIVPFAITGEYKIFNKNLTIKFSKPYKIKANADLEKENIKLKNTIQGLISESGYKWKKKK